MNAILKVTPETLRAVASSLESEGTSIKGLTDQMISMVNEISDAVWGGEASASYRAKFAALQSSMDKIHQMVTEHVQDLNEISAQYQSAEIQNQEMAEGLASNILS